jgi:hypothetical protein
MPYNFQQWYTSHANAEGASSSLVRAEVQRRLALWIDGRLAILSAEAVAMTRTLVFTPTSPQRTLALINMYGTDLQSCETRWLIWVCIGNFG